MNRRGGVQDNVRLSEYMTEDYVRGIIFLRREDFMISAAHLKGGLLVFTVTKKEIYRVEIKEKY